VRLDAGMVRARADAASAMLSPCTLCPRKCRVRRLEGEVGPCRVGAVARVASYGPHPGEEPPLSGSRGSGAVFLSGCNLRCLYCQNDGISREAVGMPVSPEGLAAIVLDLEARGCHNVNFVSPTHVMAQILAGLAEARRAGFDLPVVWNCGGYESVEALRLLDGVVDIYMPDFKYGEEIEGRRLSGVRSYPARARAAVREMHRQVGDLALDANGVAVRGLLVRHLVLPDGRAGTAAVMRFLANEISRDTYVNLMDQYRPAGRDGSAFGLDRRPTPTELEQAAVAARRAGIHRGIFP
jgi:putative pyruvate formate lyase activating enzyme